MGEIGMNSFDDEVERVLYHASNIDRLVKNYNLDLSLGHDSDMESNMSILFNDNTNRPSNNFSFNKNDVKDIKYNNINPVNDISDIKAK